MAYLDQRVFYCSVKLLTRLIHRSKRERGQSRDTLVLLLASSPTNRMWGKWKLRHQPDKQLNDRCFLTLQIRLMECVRGVCVCEVCLLIAYIAYNKIIVSHWGNAPLFDFSPGEMSSDCQCVCVCVRACACVYIEVCLIRHCWLRSLIYCIGLSKW